MSDNSNSISRRKKEHIELCLTDKVAFQNKTNGFEKYDFLHYAATEVDISKIKFDTKFLGKTIRFPFLISCMTGGSKKSENINAQMAVAASRLNIPIGVGSQRQAVENKAYHNSYKIIRKNAGAIPVLGNIGAAEVAKYKDSSPVKFMVDLVEADAMVIHVNPLQELIQNGGEPKFTGLLKSVEKLVKDLTVPVFVKEVGAGISKEAAEKLLSVGVKGIDVAGAGGTSWAGVEILRNKTNDNFEFWDWGLPTSYCLKTVSSLKKKHSFVLVGSGGINNPLDAAKAFALGADMVASARIILKTLDKSGTEGIVSLVENWFDVIRSVMFLTGSSRIKDLQIKKIIRKEELY